MKKFFKGFLLTFGILIFLVAVFYLSVSFKYANGFTYGTWVNGIYITGMDIEIAKKELLKQNNEQYLTFCGDFFEEEKVLLSDINFSVDYSEYLKELYKKQNSFLWFLNFSDYYTKNIASPDISFDEYKLKEAISNLEVTKAHPMDYPSVVEIRMGKNGYYLYEDCVPSLDKSKVFDEAKKALEGNLKVFLPNECLISHEYSKEEEQTVKLFEKIKAFTERSISFDMGDEIESYDSLFLSKALKTGNSGLLLNSDDSFVIDEEFVKEEAQKICHKYNTYGLPRDYVTFSGEKKHIENTYYGTEINAQKLEEEFLDAVVNVKSAVIVPKYVHYPFHRGLNDIGDTFIEVDLTNQKMIYVKNNELILSTDVVTGNPNRGAATPEMVGYVYKKAEDVKLKGEDYLTPVKYWMPFYKSIGLHDATWQAKFGGERYLRYGSHGCVNLKKEDATFLYGDIPVGIPVIVYK